MEACTYRREWGSGRAVLALHPLGLESSAFGGVGRLLAGRSVRTIALDLPGFGRTPSPGVALTPALLAESVIAVARELEMPPTVIGISLGGRVALEAAMRAPEAFESVIAIAPYLPWIRYRALLAGAWFMSPWAAERLPLERVWPLLRWLATLLEATPALRDDPVAQAGMRFIYYSACPATRTAFVSAARELALDPAFGPSGFWTRPPALPTTTTFVWGERDRLIASGFARQVARSRPDAHQLLLPCVGHWWNGPHHRCLAEALAALLDGSLAKATTGGEPGRAETSPAWLRRPPGLRHARLRTRRRVPSMLDVAEMGRELIRRLRDIDPIEIWADATQREIASQPFQRDVGFLRRLLPLMELLGSYFDAEVRGLEHVPATGPVLLVGNHSGGVLTPDTSVLFAAWYRTQGLERPLIGLAFDAAFGVPGFRALMRRIGEVPANRENARRALEAGLTVLVYPGGEHEVFRPWRDRNRIDFNDRKGFVRLAIRLGVPVVPVVGHGGHSSTIILTRGDWIGPRPRPGPSADERLPDRLAGTLGPLPGRAPGAAAAGQDHLAGVRADALVIVRIRSCRRPGGRAALLRRDHRRHAADPRPARGGASLAGAEPSRRGAPRDPSQKRRGCGRRQRGLTWNG